MQLSRRLQELPPYHFAEYNRKIAALRALGVDVINLSMGDPDLPTPPEVLSALETTAAEPYNQRYPEYAGMPQLREAFAAWFARRFGVTLDPMREVLPLIGSKEGLAHLPLAVLNPGEVALVPDPAYPVYPTAVALAEGQVRSFPLSSERGWLPDLAQLTAQTPENARMLWLNYPNNPTGASAPLSFFEEAIAFARERNLLVLNDMAYADVRYDGNRPPSILQAEEARDVAVEFYSFSKAYNMAGFRIGMLVGNATIIEGMTRLKSNLDTGIFRPIQLAAIRALDLPESWLEARNAIYQGRRDRMVVALRQLGLEVAVPEAGLYLWPRVPDGVSSSQFALDLLDKAAVALTPGTNFGPGGEGYLRVSLTVPDEQIDAAIGRLERALAVGV